MAKKPLDQSDVTASFPPSIADWIVQFKKHFAIAFHDECAALADEVEDIEMQQAVVAAMVSTLRDSGMEDEQFLRCIAQAFTFPDSNIGAWTSKLNDRRVKLIDKEIQNEISFAEKVELASLTNAMRSFTDSGTNLPLDGARALHAKLKAIGEEDHAS